MDLDKARALDKWTVSRLITLFEDSRASARARRRDVLAALTDRCERRAYFVGITGAPGAGKSTLVGQLATRLVDRDPAVAVAVLAVDPTSHVSGGALLGDRTRVRFPLEQTRLFFRSQASDRDLGGVGRATFQVCRLLFHLFDYVLIETVGIGQSEVEIEHIADRTYLVLQPLAGDQIQFMKAGIMEVPAAFVLNKCDEVEAARRSYHALRASLSLARPGRGEAPPIFRTSATTGSGIDAVVDDIAAASAAAPAGGRGLGGKERYFFDKWIREQYGREGARLLAAHATSTGAFVTDAGGYDAAQDAFAARFPEWVAASR